MTQKPSQTTPMKKFDFDRVKKKAVGKDKNACHQHFLFFLQCFQSFLSRDPSSRELSCKGLNRNFSILTLYYYFKKNPSSAEKYKIH